MAYPGLLKDRGDEALLSYLPGRSIQLVRRTPNSLGRLEDGMLLGRATPHVSRLYCHRTLLLYPKGDNQQGQLSLYLSAAGSATLPEGWARHASFTLTVKNHLEVATRSVMKRAQRNGANNQTRVGRY